MEVIHTAIDEVLILEPRVFGDARGYFFEAYSEREFCEKVCRTHFVQDNQSRSVYGVVRGLHYQLPPYAQAKLLRCICGRVLDVAVDIRRGSPTFGKYVAVELTDRDHRQLFIPKGFAHGFAVLSDEAVIQYKCDSYYAPQAEGALMWNDPSIGIEWPVPADRVILSDKDRRHPTLDDPAAQLFDYNERPY